MSHSEMKELITAKKLMREGRIKEAYQIVLGLEKTENFTAEELLLDNCSRALTNLENVCWVCDVPIDPLKRVKPYTEDGEENINETTKR